MRVRFARWLAVSVTSAGLALVAFGIVLVARDNTDVGFPVVVSGAVLAIIGGLYFGPLSYVVVSESLVAVPIVRGGQGRVTVGANDRIRMVDDRIVVQRPGQKQKVPALRVFADRGDWENLVVALRERRFDT